MPFIDESDLLDLHKDIEKSQIINERLLDQIKFKNKDLKKIKTQRNLLVAITGIFVLGIIFITALNIGANTTARTQGDLVLHSLDSLEAYKTRINSLKLQNQELSLIKEFYLAKQFIEKEKVYSVQIKSFVDNNITLASEALTNTLFVKTNPFYAYSLGTFETLEEAQDFRKQLVNIGFEDAFVASYKDGQRVKIEAAN